ncbi:11005_t:CDS:2, partial [Funneliformis mosseae]
PYVFYYTTFINHISNTPPTVLTEMDIDKSQSISTISSTIAKSISTNIYDKSCSLITPIINKSEKIYNPHHKVLFNEYTIEEFFLDEFNDPKKIKIEKYQDKLSKNISDEKE